MSSLRSQILSEIKKLLNEAGGSAEQNVVGTKDPGTEGLQKIKDQAINLMVKYKKMASSQVQEQNPEESRILLHNLKRYLYWGNRGGAYQIQYADFMNTFQLFKRSEAFNAVCKLGNVNGAYNDVIPMVGVVNKTAASNTKITICGGIVAGGEPSPQPKPPTPDVKPGPETCPPGEFLLNGRCVKLTAEIICKGPQIINCVPKCKDHPNLQPPKCAPPCKPGQKTGCAEEKEIKKYPGCKPGSEAKGFVGFNGVTSGPEVESIQRALKYYHFKETGEADRSRGFKYKGMTDQGGTFGPATESALYDFQAQNGGKYAAKLKNELGSSLGNPDACAGPRTACALVLVAGTAGVRGGTIAGYDLAKCKARFGKKKIEKGRLAQAEPEEAAGGLAESKNWLDRTREETASNLFERLVKDAAKKVI